MIKKILWTIGIVLASLVILVGILYGVYAYYNIPPKLETADDFETYLQRRVDQRNSPFLGVAVVKDGQAIYAKTFGEANPLTGEKATNDHLFMFYSVTKLVTSATIMQLQEDGLLNIDDPVSDYLPEFDLLHESGKPITIRHLMSHTGGLVEPVPVEQLLLIRKAGESGPTLEEQTGTMLAAHPVVDAPPGARVEYINFDYILLGRIIEVVTGQSYGEAVTSRIFEPLGMQSARFALAGDDTHLIHGTHWKPIPYGMLTGRSQEEVAALLDPLTEGQVGNRLVLEPYYIAIAPPGGMLGTIDDAVRLTQLFANRGTVDGVQVLSEESIGEMMAPTTLDDGTVVESALGWWDAGTIHNRAYVRALGGWIGFQTEIRVFPAEGFGVFVVGSDTFAMVNNLAAAASEVKW